LGEKTVHVPSIMQFPGWKKDATNDKRLVKEFYDVLVSADIWVTYYGKGFDVPYFQAKLLEHGLPYLPNTPHVDLYFTVKSNLAISRKSLANVSWFLRLEAKKTPVDGRSWKRAMAGHAPSIRYVIDHCKADVLVLEEAYMKLRPLVRQHPRVGEFLLCSHCGSHKIQRRGIAMCAGAKQQQRIQCMECGAWSKRPLLRFV
jgi:hypothetical protein